MKKSLIFRSRQLFCVTSLLKSLAVIVLISLTNISLASSPGDNALDCISHKSERLDDYPDLTRIYLTNNCSHDVMVAFRLYGDKDYWPGDASYTIFAKGTASVGVFDLDDVVPNDEGKDYAWAAAYTEVTPYGIKKRLQLYDGDHSQNKEYWMDRLEFPPDHNDYYRVYTMYDDPPLSEKERRLSTIDGYLQTHRGWVCWARGDASAPVTRTQSFVECLNHLGIPFDD